MPIHEESDRHPDDTQRGRKLVLNDPDETIQSKLPVADGEVILTQTRLYLATGGRTGVVPNIRLERADPRAVPEEEFLELAPRMGAQLGRGQTGAQFLKMVEEYRSVRLDEKKAAQRSSSKGIRRRYDNLLTRAQAQGESGDRPKMKHTLRVLYDAHPERTEAARRLGATYLEEGNARAAVVWLARGRAFDARFDQALAQVEQPRLPSREFPPPEEWIDRNLMPLLDLPEDGGPDDEQRARIRAARERITRYREATGRATPMGWISFLLAVMVWILLLALQPWVTLGVTAVAAIGVGLFAARKRPDRRHPKR